MLDWLGRFLRDAAAAVGNPITSLLGITLGALAGVFGSLTGNVAGSWLGLAANFLAMDAGTAVLHTSIVGLFDTLIRHLIPHYAITAWWWVTHPDKLAESLVFYLAYQLERYAWTIARYLGQFVLALIVRNVRQVALLAEQIITAVL